MKGVGGALKHMPLNLYGIENVHSGHKKTGLADGKDEELNMEIEYYVTSVSALLKLIQVSYDTGTPSPNGIYYLLAFICSL